jgi:homoserine kinase
MKNKATAFAPATVANVAVGFDILGFPLENVGDQITVTRVSQPGVTIESITGLDKKLPLDPLKNTASLALLELQRQRHLNHGFTVHIHKGLPLSAGMGGSAASAVGAVVAANALLDQPLEMQECLQMALAGEHVASGAWHADNVAPCLMGGLTLIAATEPFSLVNVPVPAGITCVLIHPHLEIETKASRAALQSHVQLRDHIRQSANLAGFLMGCAQNNLNLIEACLRDHVIEPQRAMQIPGFFKAQERAMQLGALGFSISGSGPSLFAWARSPASATTIHQGLCEVFAAQGLTIDSWVSPISTRGAYVMSES